MKIQKHKRNLHVGSKSKQDRANWDRNYDQVFAKCPTCKRSRGEPGGCPDRFHGTAG